MFQGFKRYFNQTKEELDMTKKLVMSLVIGVFILGLGSAANAGKPMIGDPNYPIGIGNGFPSGLHYNFLIHGKEATFTCPPAQYLMKVTVDGNGDGDLGQLVQTCDTEDTCVQTQIFGNVVNVPREPNGDPMTLLMESGFKGPKSAPDTSVLEVTDWCTESFPDDGSSAPPLGDSAVVRLPSDPDGYAVYARVLGKPGVDGAPMFNMVPSLNLVKDEAGNDLLLLGFVTPIGVFNAAGLPINRYDSAIKGKAAKTATNLTSLFEWTGDVCYIQEDSDLYCLEDALNVCTTRAVCCVDNSDPADLIYDRCDLLTDVGIDPDLDGNYVCPATDVDGFAYTVIDAQCRHYDNKWVFNIADFVDVLWDIQHTGIYNVQIRFYPLPLNQGE
jgi:hypothetical protein